MITDPLDDMGFDRAVETYIRLGAHERRGLSADEYRARCQRLWDACPTSNRLPYKVLVDRSLSLADLQSAAGIDYEDQRVRDGVDVEPKDYDLYCAATGLFRYDWTPVGRDEATRLAATTSEQPEKQPVLFALFDVLGAEARLSANGLDALLDMYSALIDRVLVVDELVCNVLHRVSDDEYCPAMFTLPVRYAYFSDTLLLWLPLAQYYVAPFLGRCAELICAAIDLGVPVRGAIAIGEAVLHQPTNTYLGAPIVEAARLEAAQDWLGAALGPSTMWPSFMREVDPRMVFPTVPPHKPGTDSRLSGYALDWPRRWRDTRDRSISEALSVMNTIAEHSRYYDNALRFAETSAANEDWYRVNDTRVWAEPVEFVGQYCGPTTYFNEAGEVAFYTRGEPPE